MSDDDEKKKGENPNQPSLPLVGGHKLIAYKPSDAVEGEIAIIEKILAGRIRSITKASSIELYFSISFQCAIKRNSFILE